MNRDRRWTEVDRRTERGCREGGHKGIFSHALYDQGPTSPAVAGVGDGLAPARTRREVALERERGRARPRRALSCLRAGRTAVPDAVRPQRVRPTGMWAQARGYRAGTGMRVGASGDGERVVPDEARALELHG